MAPIRNPEKGDEFLLGGEAHLLQLQDGSNFVQVDATIGRHDQQKELFIGMKFENYKRSETSVGALFDPTNSFHEFLAAHIS